MSRTLLIDRFKRLPRPSAEVWQGAVLRLPTWVPNAAGRLIRPHAAVWTSLRSGRVNIKVDPAGGSHTETALDALLEFGTKSSLAGCRPARLEVRDRALGEHLAQALGELELEVTTRADLPELAAVIADLASSMAGERPVPDALSAEGVTVARMRAFAAAAKAFYEAAPWRHLTNDDLIHVEAPRMARDLSHVMVLGSGRRQFGLAFFESRDDFDDLAGAVDPAEFFEDRSAWSVLFGPIHELPFGDDDLWEGEGLPVAGASAYPLAWRAGLGAPAERPDAQTLAYLEGLLCALADTTEEELDRGRWKRSVTTADGPVTFVLALTDVVAAQAGRSVRRAGIRDRRVMERALSDMERLLSTQEFADLDQANEFMRERFSGMPVDDLPSTAATPLEQAQDLVYEAFDARGRRQLQLARQALAISPDCADAYVLLAERAETVEDALELYAKGVAAGERALGPETFTEEAGHFWGVVRTRPYMRARFGLAETLESLERVDEAIEHYRELLRLNPSDNQGVRYLLLALLLRLERNDEAGALLAESEEEVTALWNYGRALWTFRREGDSPAARDRLRAALRANRHVVEYLADEDLDLYEPIDSFAIGSEEEAIACARELEEAWRATRGAVEWVKAGASSGRKSRRKKRRGR